MRVLKSSMLSKTSASAVLDQVRGGSGGFDDGAGGGEVAA